jgi:hypothetical protein
LFTGNDCAQSEAVQLIALNHHQRHQPFFLHRIATTVGIEPGVAALMQVLAVIGGVDQQRIVQPGLSKHPGEELAHVP